MKSIASSKIPNLYKDFMVQGSLEYSHSSNTAKSNCLLSDLSVQHTLTHSLSLSLFIVLPYFFLLLCTLFVCARAACEWCELGPACLAGRQFGEVLPFDKESTVFILYRKSLIVLPYSFM